MNKLPSEAKNKAMPQFFSYPTGPVHHHTTQQGGWVLHGSGEAHSKWPQPAGESSPVWASDKHNSPAGTGSLAMEWCVPLQLNFRSTCSLHVDRCTGSDIEKPCAECHRAQAAELDGASGESSLGPANQLTCDAGEDTGAHKQRTQRGSHPQRSWPGKARMTTGSCNQTEG